MGRNLILGYTERWFLQPHKQFDEIYPGWTDAKSYGSRNNQLVLF